MSCIRSRIFAAALKTLNFSGVDRLLQPLFGGIGMIFMLHHVRPASDSAFQPNRHLEITPEFLRTTLQHVRQLKIDIITLDEMHRRMRDRDFGRRFACFTFDDGYRDNRDYALPVMACFGAPSSIYVTSDFASGTGRLWWVALERLIAKADAIEVDIADQPCRLDCRSAAAKRKTFVWMHDLLRGLPSDSDVNRIVSDLCSRHGVDDRAISRELCLSWSELQAMAADPLVTIGAHTMSHCALAKCSSDEAEREIAGSRAAIEAKLGRQVLHFAYPYGDSIAAGARDFAIAQKLGFRTAVTTRSGMLFAEHAEHLTELPRLLLNGNHQDERLLKVLTSGTATGIRNAVGI